MPKKITNEQRQAILRLLAQGHDRDTIAALAGVTPGQVSAVSAHVRMGTYALPTLASSAPATPLLDSAGKRKRQVPQSSHPTVRHGDFAPIPLGPDVESGQTVFWNPDPETGAANPHVLILGESGFGKTYTISCLLAELSQRGVSSIVFDYGQGFALDAAPKQFVEWTRPVEVHAARDGIDVNPLTIFETDVLGPINVAQRVADTFCRVYSRLGVQQHAVLRQAVIDTFSNMGIDPANRRTWDQSPPPFRSIFDTLQSIASDPLQPQSSVAASVASHISTMFVFNTFRPTGQHLDWSELLKLRDRVVILQLKGLEYSLEQAVTEFLLWNLIGYVESKGPSPLRCFVVLDEAHRMSFDRGTPVEKLLREGRKFGLGLLLASQQPEDFSPVAFGNTATKVVFQISDDKSAVTRQLHRKLKDGHSFADLFNVVTKLPRGSAYVVSENVGRIVSISSFDERPRIFH